jgi:hypothetical protein
MSILILVLSLFQQTSRIQMDNVLSNVALTRRFCKLDETKPGICGLFGISPNFMREFRPMRASI